MRISDWSSDLCPSDLTLLAGTPGFAHSPDAKFLQIDRMPDPRDPVAEGWVPGEPVGLLGIELHTRRRNRLNGTLVRRDSGAVGVAVDQSYGNCPQYIHARHLELVRDPEQAWQGDIQSGQGLEDRKSTPLESRASCDCRM